VATVDFLTILADFAGSNVQMVTLGLVFAGILLVTIGAAASFGRDEVERRYGAAAAEGVGTSGSVSARRQAANDSWGAVSLGGVLAPTKEHERLAVRRRLIHAGYRGPNAVFLYFLIRAGLGLLLPGLLMIATLGFAFSAGSFDIELPLIGVSASSTILLLALLILIGYYAPPLFVRRRIRLRQQAIREAFPNALDLMQVAVQAGLGFDAALTRIAEEMRGAHPVLAEDLGTMVLEMRAGKPRDRVLNDLGERTGVEEITAFATVMNQSMSYGTSISDALETYAKEMRSKRMMRAEELANQLPVKMSVVMVLCLLPILFLIVIGPIAIRMIRTLLPMISSFD
jgi:tight adherence protein C